MALAGPVERGPGALAYNQQAPCIVPNVKAVLALCTEFVALTRINAKAIVAAQ